jgi:hypothetical protein
MRPAQPAEIVITKPSANKFETVVGCRFAALELANHMAQGPRVGAKKRYPARIDLIRTQAQQYVLDSRMLHDNPPVCLSLAGGQFFAGYFAARGAV